MVILTFLVGLVAALLLLYVVTVKAVEIVGVLFLLALCITVVVGYVSLIVSGISVSALYQLWGGSNIGWAIAASGLIGLTTACALLRAIVSEVKSLSVTIKSWFWPRGTVLPYQPGIKEGRP